MSTDIKDADLYYIHWETTTNKLLKACKSLIMSMLCLSVLSLSYLLNRHGARPWCFASCYIYVVKLGSRSSLPNLTFYYLELNEVINGQMVRDGAFYVCQVCGYRSNKSSNCQSHIESKHVSSSGFNCTLCGLFCPNRNSLKMHNYRHHKMK